MYFLATCFLPKISLALSEARILPIFSSIRHEPGLHSPGDQLLAFREVTGDLGTLLYAGKDWEDRSLGIRSMELMAEKVMPEINAAIDGPEATEQGSRGRRIGS